jgi:hypothetical protein
MFIPFLEHRDFSYNRSVFSLEEVKKTFFSYYQFPQSGIEAVDLSGRVSNIKQIAIDSASLSLETSAYLTHNLAIRRFG